MRNIPIVFLRWAPSGPSAQKLGWLECSLFQHLLVEISEVPSGSPKVVTLVFGSSPLLFMSSAPFWWSPVSQDQIMLKWPYNLSSTWGHFFVLRSLQTNEKTKLALKQTILTQLVAVPGCVCRGAVCFLNAPPTVPYWLARGFMSEKEACLWGRSQGVHAQSWLCCSLLKEIWQVVLLFWGQC